MQYYKFCVVCDWGKFRYAQTMILPALFAYGCRIWLPWLVNSRRKSTRSRKTSIILSVLRRQAPNKCTMLATACVHHCQNHLVLATALDGVRLVASATKHPLSPITRLLTADSNSNETPGTVLERAFLGLCPLKRCRMTSGQSRRTCSSLDERL